MGFKPREEEYGVIGSVTLQAFHSDKSDFIAFSDVYDGSFEADFRSQITAVNNVVTTKFYMNELSGLTDKILKDTNLIFPKLNLLERYIYLAKDNLSKAPKLFGIGEVRKAGRKRNMEGLVNAFGTLFLNVEKPADFAAIKAKGLKDADYAVLKDLASQLVTENETQEFYKTVKSTAIEENWGLFDGLMNTIKDVQMTGKALFKFTNKAKLDTYTMQVILRRLRHDALHTFICGTVVLGELDSANKLKVIARPILKGKRGKTVFTDVNGYFEIKGVVPGSYEVKCRKPDGKYLVGTAEAVTNKKVTVVWKD